jgi:hypothetical protein
MGWGGLESFIFCIAIISLCEKRKKMVPDDFFFSPPPHPTQTPDLYGF